jgi:tRNA 2-selenouridine synthase
LRQPATSFKLVDLVFFLHGQADIVEMPMEFRVQRIVQEYVIEMAQEFLDAHPTNGWELFVAYLTGSLSRVQKRLGLENYKRLAALMDGALRQQGEHGDTNGHEAWVTAMLKNYYDPMYAYQLEKQSDRIVFQGNYDEVLKWVSEAHTNGIASRRARLL